MWKDYVAGEKKNTLPCDHTFHNNALYNGSSNVACPCVGKLLPKKCIMRTVIMPLSLVHTPRLLFIHTHGRNVVVPVESPVLPSLSDTPRNAGLESVSESEIEDNNS